MSSVAVSDPATGRAAEAVPAGREEAHPQADAAERLRRQALAMRLSFTWFGTRKMLTPEQKARAAEPFGAEGQFISAAKKLIDTSDAKFRAVTAVRNRAVGYWRANSLPFPEPGIRLIRRSDLQQIEAQMRRFRQQLEAAVTELQAHYHHLRQAARLRLGSLYNPADYPDSLAEQFAMSWDYPSVEPPPYLQWLDPQLYQQQCRAVAARFQEAVRLAEQAFIAELAKLVDHLAERLAGQQDGRPKIFRDSAVQNLREFFDRFRHLSLHSSAELDELVERARQLLAGIGPQQLRDSEALRRHVAARLTEIGTALEGLMTDRPRRNIIRRRS